MNGSSKSRSPEAKKAAADGRRSTRGATGRGSVARSESPTKKTPARKMATPRKPRNRTVRGGSAQPESINGDLTKHEEETVKVQVETEKLPSPDGEDEIEHTKVNIEMPAHSPDLELPNDAETMLEKAREMVEAANQVGGGRPTSPLKSKRKASEMDPDDLDAPVGPVAKRARQTELELRKERIKRRALTGIATCVAIGYVAGLSCCSRQGPG